MAKYDFGRIEKKWQSFWQKNGIYTAKDKGSQPKKYVLIEFPYPSGEGLHMGHLRPYVAGDVYSRYMRMKGHEVMYPIGWDAFGLPAENFAIRKGVNPAVSTAQNIKNAKAQLKSWGIGFDWSRETNTTDPKFYKWTQWIFLQFFKAGLAYEATGLINWCPKDKTGLANEEVINGRCERCGSAVTKKQMRQWYLKITAYAEKLLRGLKKLNWPESIKIQQENWIGRSEGASVKFKVKSEKLKVEEIKIFTTRPDTILGATFVAVSPELAKKWLDFGWKTDAKIKKYIAHSLNNRGQAKEGDNAPKTGVFSGVYAINPATKKKIPVWIADYVLSDYGTGAIMAVPAHDERDKEFAKKFKLPVSNAPLTSFTEAIKKSGGRKTVQYRLRDWVFSRQRYWGEPIPLIHCGQCGTVPVPEKDLPVKLPPVKKYKPTGTGESPLAAVKNWVNVKCPKCAGPAKRETNTMPQWAGSSWYYLRYADPGNKKQFAAPEKLKRWLPVDAYFGGYEHTTLHLLYSRFWHLFLYDKKLVPTPEPYAKRIPHGIILGPDGEKMSKSRGNVVSPDEVVRNFGADALRMYELFLGPHEATVSWNTNGILGIARFLERARKLFGAERFSESSPGIQKLLHRTVKKVTEDIENLHYNTAISALMVLLNEMEKTPGQLSKVNCEMFLKLLAPFAPHMSEEIWQNVLGNKDSIHISKWPEYDPELIKEDTFTLVIQVNGKVRGSTEAKAGISQSEAEELALQNERVGEFLKGAKPRKVIYVPGRLINIVI